jgi:hypothetical protein
MHDQTGIHNPIADNPSDKHPVFCERSWGGLNSEGQKVGDAMVLMLGLVEYKCGQY